MNSDMEELLRAASYLQTNTASLAVTGIEARNSEQILKENTTAVQAASPVADASNLAVEINRLTEATRTAAAENVAPPSKSQIASSQKDDSITETLVRTAAMFTGVGPIVTGLMKLFGSDEPEPLPPLAKYQAPATVSVEAGLSSTREIGEIRYAQGVGAQVVGGAQNTSPQASIQVNIQAMDSQSFLDRQDDIARAVREAMLHSNSLNDVVLEL